MCSLDRKPSVDDQDARAVCLGDAILQHLPRCPATHSHHQNRHYTNNKPPKTRLATLKDYHNKTGTITINNTHTTDKFDIASGGMQGGTRTPKEFNNCINYALKPIITKWHNMDMGFKLEDKQINHIIWADNIFIF